MSLRRALAGTTWILDANPDGQAQADTRLSFGPLASGPLRGWYSGPNVQAGQTLLTDDDDNEGATMFYHAASGAELAAGAASVVLHADGNGLTLHWHWLHQEGSGQSHWHRAGSGKPGSPDDPLIVALDLDTFEEAVAVVEELGPVVTWYKLGHQLLSRAGPTITTYLTSVGKRVFLDLKLHEIPNSAAAAVRQARDLGATAISAHASGGRPMLQACADAAGDDLQLWALTVVSGLDDAELRVLGFHEAAEALSLRLAKLAIGAGANGIITSAREAGTMRSALGDHFDIICPGIRPAHNPLDDQVRHAAPAFAAAAGASRMIVGRPILAANARQDAAAAILAEFGR